MYINGSAICQPSSALSLDSIHVEKLPPRTHVKPVQFSTAASNGNIIAVQTQVCKLVEASSVCTSARMQQSSKAAPTATNLRYAEAETCIDGCKDQLCGEMIFACSNKDQDRDLLNAGFIPRSCRCRKYLNGGHALCCV